MGCIGIRIRVFRYSAHNTYFNTYLDIRDLHLADLIWNSEAIFMSQEGISPITPIVKKTYIFDERRGMCVPVK